VPVKRTETKILGRTMSCLTAGTGTESIVFLHGNPTSAYLWRNIMPYVSGVAECLAPDLIGMGQSEKLDGVDPGRYSFAVHAKYVDAFLAEMTRDKPVTLVLHDWGSALGFDWARRHPDRVTGIVYMESIVRPMRWDEWPEQSRPLFEALRSAAGEKLILEKNVFIERILTASIQRELLAEEMQAYREPFTAAGESRRVMLSWPRELPFDGEPADVVASIQQYADWMSANEIPKLFINADPGAILVGAQREFCRSWKNQTEITVAGIHFIQEDSADAIGTAIADWHGAIA
jgi:haloalkane dehalogenase